MKTQDPRVFEKLANSEFPFLLALAQLFMLIPLKVYLPDLDWTTAIMYMVITLVLSQYAKGMEEKVRGVRSMDILYNGSIAAVVTVFATTFLFTRVIDLQLPTISPLAMFSIMATQIFFVAPSEELAFRFILPTWLRGRLPRSWKWTPALLSSAVFAFMHYSAYSGDWTSILLAFVIGMIWAFAYSRWGLGATIGSHCAYNLVIAGLWATAGG